MFKARETQPKENCIALTVSVAFENSFHYAPQRH